MLIAERLLWLENASFQKENCWEKLCQLYSGTFLFAPSSLDASKPKCSKTEKNV